MPLEVGRTVSAAERLILRFAQDRGSRRARPFRMRVDVVDVDHHAVHDEGHLGPRPRPIADFGVSRRAQVVRAGPAEHHDRAVELELRVGHAAGLVRVALVELTEAERPLEPDDRGDDVLVGEQRDRSLLGHHRVRGKPRSTELVAGSGHRAVTTFARV